MSPGRGRLLAFGLVLGAHVLLAYILDQGVLTSESKARPDDVVPISLTFIEERAQLSSPPAKTTRAPAPTAAPPAKARDLNRLEVPPIRFEEEPGSSITDWSAEAHAAAADTLEQERQKSRRRSFTDTPTAPLAPDSPSIFGSQQQNRRAGQVEGGTRFWVTDNCYYDVPRGTPPPRMAGEFHLLTPTCKPAPTGGGERMFEHLKPESLKSLPKKPPP